MLKHENGLFLSGSNGFIGRNFIENTNQYAIDSPRRSTLELTDYQAVDEFFTNKKYSSLIHTASVGVTRKSMLDPLQVLNGNLRVFVSLFRQRHAYDRFIQLGSGAEFGRPILRRQITEEELEQRLPNDEYGLAKLFCTKYVMTMPPARAVSLHLFGVFGPHEDYQVRFISNAIVRAMHNLPIIMNQDVEFDYVYVKDLVKILHLFIENTPAHSNYNIVTGQPVTLLELAEIVRDVTGNKVDIMVKNPGMAPAYTGSGERLKRFLPGFTFTPVKTAIAELAAWYELERNFLDMNRILNPI